MNGQTPQQALTEFLACWQRRDYAALARWMPVSGSLPRLNREPTRASVKAARLTYRQEALQSFRILAATDTDPAAANIDVELLCKVRGELELRRRRYRMIHVDGAGQPAARHQPGGGWVPYTSYALPDLKPIQA